MENKTSRRSESSYRGIFVPGTFGFKDLAPQGFWSEVGLWGRVILDFGYGVGWAGGCGGGFVQELCDGADGERDVGVGERG